jgi:hypothetical protein
MRDLSPTEAAGRIFAEVVRRLDDQRKRLGDRCLSVTYEGFCREPHRTIAAISEWSGLPLDVEMRRPVPEEFECMNWKWPDRLTPEVVEAVRSRDPELLSRFEDDSEA